MEDAVSTRKQPGRAADVVLFVQVAYERYIGLAAETIALLMAMTIGLALIALIFHWLGLDEPPTS